MTREAITSAPVVERAACDLCGLPAGRQPLLSAVDGCDRAFCCLGCLNVFTILVESGIAAADFRDSELYRQSLQLGLVSNPDQESAAIPAGSEQRQAVYQLSGLWCASCGWLIEHALRKERGVVSAEVVFTSDVLNITYCPQFLPAEAIERRVASLGYRAAPFTGDTEPAARERRDLLLRLGVAAALWMNVMLFSLVIYASYFEGIAPWARRTIPLILLALATPAVFYSGWPILRIGARSLIRGVIRMETLISSGILAAYFYSVVQIARGGNHFYLDTACAIVTLVLAGKAIERNAKAKTAQALSLQHRRMPRKARVLTAGREHFVSVDAIAPGMILLVKPGEQIPADGVVLAGHSSVDESLLTGESRPCAKAPGDLLTGGSVNGAGVLELRATRPPAESTLAQIVRSVESAMASRGEAERLVDRISRIFVPVVLVIACLTLAGSLIAGVHTADALMRAVSVLVIACPCALGIATPLATTAAVGAAARSGILIRNPSALESLGALDVLILDKTGTVTEGKFRVHHAWWSDESIPPLAAALEHVSEHPVAQAIVQAVPPTNLPVSDVTIHRGFGISGRVAHRAILIGNRRLLASQSIALDPAQEARAAAWERGHFTVVFVAVDGALAGMLALGDRLRADAEALVGALHLAGVRVALLSGDAAPATQQVARQLGISDFRSHVLPDQKAAIVREFRRNGARIAMIGDGINDAPALAAADLGIAMGSGADLARLSAPVVLMSESLMKIVDVIALARRTRRVCRANLCWAFGYNAAGISLAAFGILNPILAAGAMVVSSLCVIANSRSAARKMRACAG